MQEPAIGYPTEPGILKGWAQRIERALIKLKAGGVKVAALSGIEKVKEIYQRVKEHQLFAKTKEERKKIIQKLVQQSEELREKAEEVIKQVSERCGRVKLSAKCGF